MKHTVFAIFFVATICIVLFISLTLLFSYLDPQEVRSVRVIYDSYNEGYIIQGEDSFGKAALSHNGYNYFFWRGGEGRIFETEEEAVAAYESWKKRKSDDRYKDLGEIE